MWKTVFSVMLVLIAGSISAQKYEMGRLSPKELQETAHPRDTAAAAAVLYKKGKTTL